MSRLLIGAVLAGGEARRFGSDKAMALLDRVPLLDHAIAQLAGHVDHVVVCGRQVDGVPSLADEPAPGLGPLGGLNAALRYACERGYSGLLSTGCDMPYFPPALAGTLIGDGPAVLKGQRLAGYWPASLARALADHLATTSDLSIHAWTQKCSARTVTMPDLDMPNINTRADLEAIQRVIRGPA